MNKKQLKNNEGNFVYLDPPPLKVRGLRFEEYVAMWRIEKVYLSIARIELANPYFGYHKELPLNIVKNFDEDNKYSKFPYQITGILKLYAQLHLDGYHVTAEVNKRKWGEWHHQNYLSGKKTLPRQIPHFPMSQFLTRYFHREIAI